MTAPNPVGTFRKPRELPPIVVPHPDERPVRFERARAEIQGAKELFKKAFIITYGVMSIQYGPIDAARVAAAYVSRGDAELKQSLFDEAKGLYARRVGTTRLSERQIQWLYLELGVVGSPNAPASPAQLSYRRTFDWIEDNQ